MPNQSWADRSRPAFTVCLIGFSIFSTLAGTNLAARGPSAANADDLLIVHCLLPGQIRQLGSRFSYSSARQPAQLPAFECRVRGGEYVTEDAGSQGHALKVWLERANKGDAEAQTTVGEILERGLGVPPDLAAAARWYELAAVSGHTRAQVNLGHLYETGNGVPRNSARAVELYTRAAGIPAAIGLENRIAKSRSIVASANAESSTTAATTGGSALPENYSAGPEIILIEPLEADQFRGQIRGLVKTSGAVVHIDEATQVVGRVNAPAGLYSLTLNGTPLTTNATGLFTAPLTQTADSAKTLSVVAIDNQGQRAVLQLAAAAALPPGRKGSANSTNKPISSAFGRYHALLIGNTNYQHLPDLTTPARDVARIKKTLKTRYGFKVTTLVNATRYEILSTLNQLREELNSEDNLLIYYAGHGELEEKNQRGHWLPVDAEPENTANWLSNVDLTDVLNVMKAKQVLLVADSCYSGTLTRSGISRLKTGMTEAERATWLALMATKRARVVLSSGGVAPVLDRGGDGHSVFARAFAETLENNTDILPGRLLHQAVTARVAHAAAGFDFEQIPEYAPISRAGHEAGDFFLLAGKHTTQGDN